MAETAVAKAQPSQKAVAVKNFQAVMNNSYYQSLLQNTLKDNKGAFTTSLMELFTSDPQLMQCNPNALMGEAVKAAGLRLPINKQLGQAYIVVFNKKDKKTNEIIPTPTLIIGTKGYINLALRTNKYANINKGTVYEGELQGFDKVTGALDISGEKTSDVPVGYFAYFKQKSGFEKIMYMSLDEVCKFAKTYAPTVKYSKITWQELRDLAIKQSVEGTGGGLGWFAGFQDMAEKTVLRQLLSSWGELSVDAEQIINADERPSAIVQRDEEFAEAKNVITINADTGQAVNAEEVHDEQPQAQKFSLS
uniref:recombinase RecT n=1 Tax=Prevotella sp. TaxID=59823 RepID=UPI004029EE33